MTQRVVTISTCDRCGKENEQPCHIGRFRGAQPMPYPKDWKQVEDRMVCPDCKKEYADFLKNEFFNPKHQLKQKKSDVKPKTG